MSKEEVLARLQEQQRRIDDLSERIESQIETISKLTVPNRRLDAYAPHIALIIAIVLLLEILSRRVM